MDYEGVNSVLCDAEESDWLDVSYTERKYLKDQPKQQRFHNAVAKIKTGEAWKFAIVAVLCVAVLATMLFVDGDFKQDVFDAVKTAATSVFGGGETSKTNQINIPCNATLVDISDGVMTFNGGRVALSLTQGTVSETTADSVTVSMDDKTSVVYTNLTTVLVNVGDKVDANSLLGKYDEQYQASILQEGEVVKQVVGSETQLTWEI